MKDFLGMVRDTLPIDNPVGTWQYGRNMVSNKKQKTVSNEYGFSFEHLVNGTVIGIIVTNSDIVYFSKNDDGTDEIGVVDTTVSTPIYETKIKSSLFNFQYNCPIEGIFIYNYKEELIVAWCDGVKDNSNKPYVVNLDNPVVDLDTNKTLINSNEFTKLYMFPDRKEGNLYIDIIEGAKLVNNISGIYVTYAYAYNEDDVLPFFSISSFRYLNEFYKTFYVPILKFTDLDTNFNKIQLGLVIKLKDGTLQAYKSYLIYYQNTSLTIDINSLDNFTETTLDDIIVDKTVFKKINTITKQNKQLNVGNVVLSESLEFQKYANLLELIPTKQEAGVDNSSTFSSSLMPDEVYSFYIELQLLDGTYTDAYHIPGRIAEGNDLSIITSTQISTYGLGSHLQNIKQFYVFNTGVINTKFGYWQNEENYPNTDDFNSTVDYNGANLGGADLRGTPIRYHRVPAKTDLGYTYGSYGDSSGDSETYTIGVTVTNFNTIVPIEIRNQIQGYRLSFVKRNLNNSLVLGNLLMSNRYQVFSGQEKGSINAPQVSPYSLQYGTTEAPWETVALFGNELLLNTPSLTPFYIKLNFFRNVDATVNGKYVQLKDNIRYKQLSALKYAPNNNLDEGTAFREQLCYSTLDLPITTNNFITGETIDNGVIDVTLFSNNSSLYSGFKSNDLVIIGKTKDLSNPVTFKGGDVYIDNFHISIREIKFRNNEYEFSATGVDSPLYSPYNNVQYTLNNPPSVESFTDPDILYGIIPEDSVFNLATSELEVVGDTNTFINDITTILTFNFLTDSINNFPFRVYRSLKISNESLSISSFRSFLANSYYEMGNDKGEIIALRGADKKLFIQLKYALFIATIKDTLQTGTTKTYLGQSDIFEYDPKEILVDEKGYIGSTSKFGCIYIKDMYITINSNTGQIFIIKEGLQEISKQGNMQWFRNNWKLSKDIDNPYISYGFLVGYDKEFNRLLFIKKDYEFIADSFATFDGDFYIDNISGDKLEFTDELQLVGDPNIAEPEYKQCFINKSKTLSYSLDKTMWQFEHDYFPNIIFNTHKDLYSVITKLNGESKSKVYKHNDSTTKGLFYDKKFESYIDMIFNQNLDITKLYQSIIWVTTVLENNVKNQFKTINKIALYNDHQCSGIIELKPYSLNDIKTRNNEWNFNDFRDLVKDVNSPVLDENGEIIQDNINNLKVWFEKSNFISKFIVVRFIINNVDNSDVFIHQVNVKSIISK